MRVEELGVEDKVARQVAALVEGKRERDEPVDAECSDDDDGHAPWARSDALERATEASGSACSGRHRASLALLGDGIDGRTCYGRAPNAMSAAAPEISVVIPCLNEEEAVGKVVDQALEGIRRSGRPGEVIVVDNASTDRSAEVAAEHGATVVREERPGYGSAYLAGLAVAQGDFIVMGDADETYPMQDLAPFVERLAEGDDLVMGSRFEGTIHGEAMPWLNRHVGNPILTGLLNILFGVKISDAHCGMRAVRRDALPTLDLHSTGMEFASEMVFKAFRRELRVSEIPIDYYPRVGESKLNRFGDAWRHVKFMLLYSPSWLYFVPGLALLVLGILGALALAAGPVDVPRPHLADPLALPLHVRSPARHAGRAARRVRARLRRRPPRRDGQPDRNGPSTTSPRARPRRGRSRAARRGSHTHSDLRQLGNRRLRCTLTRICNRSRVHTRRRRRPGDPRVVLPEPVDDADDRAVPRLGRRARQRHVSIGRSVRARLGRFEAPVSDLYRRQFIDLDACAQSLSGIVDATSILEVGCGDGQMATRLLVAFPDARYVGIDVAPEVGHLYDGDPGRASFRSIDSRSYSHAADERFDLVVVVDVLHHVPPDARGALLDDVRALTTPGGHFVLKDWVRSRSIAHLAAWSSDRLITGTVSRISTTASCRHSSRHGPRATGWSRRSECRLAATI